MSPGILGRKIGMTQVFRPDGQVVPVTLLKAGPCAVVQRKTPATDGYDAVQLGLLEFVKPKRINKPKTGHLKKAGVDGAKVLREFRRGGRCLEEPLENRDAHRLAEHFDHRPCVSHGFRKLPLSQRPCRDGRLVQLARPLGVRVEPHPGRPHRTGSRRRWAGT